MSKKFETQQHQSRPDNGNAKKAYSDYRSAQRESRRTEAKFSNVTKYLKGKETRMLKNDLGLFEFPESWDIEFENSNQRH